MNTQTTTFFGGDPAFYKSSDITGDFQKRFKQMFTPGTYTVGNLSFDAIILADEFKPTKQETLNHIYEIIDNSTLTDNHKKILKLQWEGKGPKALVKKTNNISDAGTYVHPRRRKKILQDLNRWTDAHDTAYENMLKGVETIEDQILMNPPGNPEKPVYVGEQIINGIRVPLYIKNAEFVLTKSFALKEKDGKLLYPKLAAIYNDMDAGKYDTAIFESAVKLGGIGNTVVKNKKGEYEVSFTKYEEVDGKFVLPENTQILKLKESDYRLQQETPPHFIDDRSNFTTQLRNLIIADLNPSSSKTYIVDGKPHSGEKISIDFQRLIVADLKRAYGRIEKEFLTEDGKLNYNTLLPILRKAAEDRGYGQDYLDAIAPTTKSLSAGNLLEISPTVLPLYHPKIAYQTEALLNSIFRNKITKQKIKGGQIVNMPSYGVSQDLNMEVDEKTGTITLEAMMPWTSTKFFPKNEKGEVDIDFIREHAPELLEIIANRVPTEDKYSMLNIRIVGFSPPSNQGTIILPAEITTITGLDFDIDKVFFMQKAYKVDSKGVPQVIKFVDSLSRDNGKVVKSDSIDLAENIYRDRESFIGFLDQTNNISKSILLAQYDKNQEDYKERISEESKQNIEILRAAGTPQALAAIDDFYGKGGPKIDPISRIDYLEEDSKLVKTIADSLYKKAKLKEKIDFVAINPKEASDNKKISIMQAILQNEYTSPAILEGGNFDSWRLGSAKIKLLQAGKTKEAKLKGEALLKASKKLDNSKEFNINLPSTQSQLFRRNMDGADLIPIFANHNVHHAKALHTDLRLRDVIEINGIEYQSLSSSIIKGQRISRLLATDVAAVVDNSTDPLAGSLNINTFTANITALLQRLGVEEDFIWSFLNQPVILELTKNYFDSRGTDSADQNIRSLINETGKLVGTRAKVEKIDTSKDSDIKLTIDSLEKNIKEPSDLSYNYLKNQLATIKLFKKLYGIAEELSSGVQAARVDTTGLKSTNAENFILLQKQEKILKDTESSTIIGLSDVFSDFNNYSNQTMIPAFNTWGILKPSKILGKIYNTIGQYNEQTGTFTFSNLGKLKLEIADHIKGNGILNEKEVKLIDINAINYLASSFPFFQYGQNLAIIAGVPTRLKQIKKDLKNPNSVLYKELSEGKINYTTTILHFLNELSVINKDKRSSIDRIEYYTTGKGPAEFELSSDIWEKMLTSSNETIVEFARDLVKYSFFSNGYGFGPYSFSNLIPVKFWSDAYQLTIPENKGDTFNSFLKRELTSIENNGFTNKERFEEQFIKNYGTRQGLLKTVKTQTGSITVDKEGKLYINKPKNPHLVNKGEFLKYVKRFNDKGDPIIYKFVGANVHMANNRKAIIGEYIPVKSLGIPNVLLAFNRNDDIGKEGRAIEAIVREGNTDKRQINNAVGKEETDDKITEKLITTKGRPNPNTVKIAYTDAIGKSSGITKEQWDSWSVEKQNKHIECLGK